MIYGKQDNIIADQLRKKGTSFLQSPEWKRLRSLAVRVYGRKCMKCGSTPKDPMMTHVDHIKCRKDYPELALEFDNLQILCCRCNKHKGNKNSIDYRFK